MNDYVRAVLESLTDSQKKEIREADTEYVAFWVHISNIGHTTQLEFGNDITIPEDEYHSFYLETQEAIWCLDQIEKQ